MKNRIFRYLGSAIFVVIGFSSVLSAQTTTFQPQNKKIHSRQWTKGDRIIEGLYLGLVTVDWAQTRNIVAPGGTHYEANPLLGPHPSELRLDLSVGGIVAGQIMVSHFLPRRYRRILDLTSVGVEASAVAYNSSQGATPKF